MTAAPITLTLRQKRMLVVLHDLHLQALLYRTAGKRIPARLKQTIRAACRRPVQEGFDSVHAVSFEVKKVGYILWPARLIKNLSGFFKPRPRGRG